MIFLDATIADVALPSIGTDFDVGECGLQWVVAAYSLTMAMFMMTSASLSDARGGRRAYASGIVVFCGASLTCGLAPTSRCSTSRVRSRESVPRSSSVASLALVGAAYPDRAAKARAVGLWTGIAGVGLAIGPTLGGVLTEAVGWRWIFLINPIVGVVAVALTFAFVAESTDPTSHSFDPVGQLLFIVGIGGVTYALVQAPVDGFSSPAILVPLAVAVVVSGVFVRFELRSNDPMMDVRLFTNGAYTAAILTVFAVLFCGYGTLLVITQYFQNVRDYSPAETGLLLLVFSCQHADGAHRGTPVGPVRQPTADARGGAAGVRRSLTLAFSAGGAVWLTLVGLVLIGLGIGTAVATGTAVAMSDVDPERSGMASGILSSQRARIDRRVRDHGKPPRPRGRRPAARRPRARRPRRIGTLRGRRRRGRRGQPERRAVRDRAGTVGPDRVVQFGGPLGGDRRRRRELRQRDPVRGAVGVRPRRRGAAARVAQVPAGPAVRRRAGRGAPRHLTWQRRWVAAGPNAVPCRRGRPATGATRAREQGTTHVDRHHR